jgi:hypothetical protein
MQIAVKHRNIGLLQQMLYLATRLTSRCSLLVSDDSSAHSDSLRRLLLLDMQNLPLEAVQTVLVQSRLSEVPSTALSHPCCLWWPSTKNSTDQAPLAAT